MVVCLLLLSITGGILSQLNCLFNSKKSVLKLCNPTDISYVFCKGIFWISILRILAEIIIISMYYLKFRFSLNCWYWIRGALVKIMFASRAVMFLTFFLGSTGFLILVSRLHLILKSFLSGNLFFWECQIILKEFDNFFQDLCHLRIVNVFIIYVSWNIAIVSSSFDVSSETYNKVTKKVIIFRFYFLRKCFSIAPEYW